MIEKIFIHPDIGSLLLVISLLFMVIIGKRLIDAFIPFCQAEQDMMNPKRKRQGKPKIREG